MSNFLYIFFFFSLISIINSQFPEDLPFPNDNDCEKFGALFLKSYIYNEPFLPEFSDAERLIKYSGSGLDDLGDYWACKQLNYSSYFILSANLGMMSQSMGICIYKKCDLNYINNSLKNLLINILHMNNTDLIKVVNPDEELEKLKKDNKIGGIITFSILIGITSLCFYASYSKKKEIQMFNLQKNAKTIFSVRNANETYEHLRVFDGVRFFSAAWIAYGHLCVFPMSFTRNMMGIMFIAQKWNFAFLAGAYYAVDVFFFLSGFLFYFGSVKYFNKDIQRIKLIIFGFINRWLRLFPFLLFTCLGITYILPFFSNGPNYSNVNSFNAHCKKNWWHNFLYINNLIHYGQNDGMCATQTWYLGCDMQFFVVSILIVFLFNKSNLLRQLSFGFIFLGSTVLQMYLCIKHHYAYNEFGGNGRRRNGGGDDDDGGNFFLDFYISPYARVPAYIIGIYFSMLFMETPLYRKDYPKKKEEKKVVIRNSIDNINSARDTLLNSEAEDLNNDIIENLEKKSDENIIYRINVYIQENDWAAYTVMVVALIMLNFSFWTSVISAHTTLTNVENALFNTFNKYLFITGMGLVFHLTFLGRFKFIKYLLTFKVMTTVSRSTYGIYMIHVYFMFMFFASYNNYYYITMVDYALLAMGIYFFTWLISFILGIILESPVIGISKKLFRNEDGKKQEKKNLENTILIKNN